MADGPVRVAELILALLEFDGEAEVELSLHTRDHGIVQGHLTGALRAKAAYVDGDVDSIMLTGNDIVRSRRKEILRSRRKRRIK